MSADRRTGRLASLVAGEEVRVRDLDDPSAPLADGVVTHITPSGCICVYWLSPIGWSWTRFGPRGGAYGLRLERPVAP